MQSVYLGSGRSLETRGQVWRVQRARIMPDGSRFQVSTTYGSGVMGVESSAIETNGVSELLKFAQVFF